MNGAGTRPNGMDSTLYLNGIIVCHAREVVSSGYNR
jgi:hypothetical protein